MYWKEPKTEQEALNVFWNANIVNIERIVKLKCHKDHDVTNYMKEIMCEAPPVYEDKEFDLEDFYKTGKQAIAHYTRVETGKKPKFWTLMAITVDDDMVFAAFINGGDKEEVVPEEKYEEEIEQELENSIKEIKKLQKKDKEESPEEDKEEKEINTVEEAADYLNDKLKGTGVQAVVVEFKAEMSKLRDKAVGEIKEVLNGMVSLYEKGAYPTIGCIANLIFKEDWALGNPNCPTLPEDNKAMNPNYTALFKVFAEYILLTQAVLPIDDGLEDYNASSFLDALFVLDPSIGMNFGTSLVQICHAHNMKCCNSLIEYARRYMDE